MGIRSIIRGLRDAVMDRVRVFGAARRRHVPPHEGPPAVALGRHCFAGNPDISIDPLETEFRFENGRVMVRAWVALPKQAVSPANRVRIETTAIRLGRQPAGVRRVLFLSISYRLGTIEIARMFGISRWRTRRLLLRGLAALDGKAHDRSARRPRARPYV